MMIARCFIVKGRVQGVGFRYFAVQAAHASGVVGTVRNLPDGSVEAIAEGSPEALADFRERLAHGSSFSRVAAVEEFDVPPSGRYRRFEVTY